MVPCITLRSDSVQSLLLSSHRASQATIIPTHWNVMTKKHLTAYVVLFVLFPQYK